MTLNKKNKNKGQTMLITVVMFIFFSLTAVFGIVNPVLRHSKILINMEKTKKSFFLTEVGLEDIIYRLKSGKKVGSSNTLDIDGETITTLVADDLDKKVITSTSSFEDYVRKVESKLTLGTGASFFYGLQTGTGGLEMSNNSRVNGNVYANGNIEGSNGAEITGSAYAANISNLSIDQSNELPIPPSSNIEFGKNSTNEDLAQSFVVSNTNMVNKISIYISKIGTPNNLTIRIASDNSGNPGNTIAQGTLSASLVTGTKSWIEVPLSSNPTLNAGSRYWLVLDGSNNSSKYYSIGANSNYSSGIAKIGKYNPSWNNTSPVDLDSYFKIFMGGIYSTIDGLTIGASGGAAHAHTVNNSNVGGNLYCISGSGNNKSCDSSLPDPTEQPYPISDANILEWKEQAENGGTIMGNYTLSDSSNSIGPKKIIGNLIVSNNANLTLNGTLWVTGQVLISNNSIIRLSSGYGGGSGVIVSDNYVDISNGSQFYGSGSSGSYVLLLSTLTCPGGSGCSSDNAINVGNNAGAVILNAVNGGVHFSNNARAKSAIGREIELDNNAIIDYEIGLSNINFVSGPSGGFDILSWKEVE